MTIVAKTLSDQAFDLIRERILSNALAPLAPIRQEALAEELGISRIPIREALARLEQQGLLESHANRGFFVAPVSAAEAGEVFALRLKLEPDAAAAACLHADEPRRARARALLDAMESSLHQDPARAMALHRDFHLALTDSAEHRLTAQMLEHLHIVAERYVRMHLEPQGRDARADREHRELLDAWLARDSERVAQALAAHIAGALEDLRAQLPADTTDDAPARGRRPR
jgi:DNA-binding GntR family transcriptional regulator